MIIHSITPIPLLLPESTLPPTATMTIADGILEGEPGPDGFAIRRLISTNPASYLKKEYAPGALYQPPKTPGASV